MFMRANLNEMVRIDPLDGSAGRSVVNKSVRSFFFALLPKLCKIARKGKGK